MPFRMHGIVETEKRILRNKVENEKEVELQTVLSNTPNNDKCTSYE